MQSAPCYVLSGVLFLPCKTDCSLWLQLLQGCSHSLFFASAKHSQVITLSLVQYCRPYTCLLFFACQDLAELAFYHKQVHLRGYIFLPFFPIVCRSRIGCLVLTHTRHVRSNWKLEFWGTKVSMVCTCTHQSVHVARLCTMTVMVRALLWCIRTCKNYAIAGPSALLTLDGSCALAVAYVHRVLNGKGLV